MISLLLRLLLYPSPKIRFRDDEIAQYEQWASMMQENRLIADNTPYPKHRFLQYLSLKKKYVFHGSNNRHIDRLEPRKQTLYNNQWTNAVFATTDPNWAIIFAVLDRSRLVGSFRNGCIVGRNQTYHYYSLNESTMKNQPWTDGVVYILPRNLFKKSGQGSVTLNDFYFKIRWRRIGTVNLCSRHGCVTKRELVFADSPGKRLLHV